MSRLPTLTTPARLSGSPGGGPSGIPAPSSRRPRSSIGPNNAQASLTKNDPERDQAYTDLAMRRRPPSALGRSMGPKDTDPDTPTQVRGGPAQSFLQTPSSNSGLNTSRSPGLRPRTPSSMTTPSSRANSRPSLSARSSMASSSNTPARRPSLASSTSTPSYRRPESRAGLETSKWTPAVGDRVRLPSHGYEGTLRYLGPTHIRDGIWAGVELEGGFKGKGRNDGSVDNVKYFQCEPNCGIFALAEKLAPPTAAPAPTSRPASVASHRSLTSSYSASGRATPASERVRRGATTPSFGNRSVSTRTPKKVDDDTAAPKSAHVAANITEGSRASKYLGMTAKQLDARSSGSTSTGLALSNSVTPKASKIGTTTPGRVPRPSLGGSLATPKARAARQSEMMPPPPSPHASKTADYEKEIEELRRRNADLDDQLASVPDTSDDIRKLEALQTEVENAKAEADALRIQLSASSGDAKGVKQQIEELQSASSKLKEDLASKEREVAELQKEMRISAERAAHELEAGMDARRVEMRQVEERADAAETEVAELKKLVDELTTAGNQIIELNENKQFQFEERIRELEEKLAKAAEEAAVAEAKLNAMPADAKPRTAAEIDNETLTDQIKHLQSRILHLEEQLEDTRGQAETDSDAWQAKYNKSRDAEKAVEAELQRSKAEISKLNKEATATKERIAELQGALSENQAALESARAEIETLRQEATERPGKEGEGQIAELKEQLEGADKRVTELESQVLQLESDLQAARKRSMDGDVPVGRAPRKSSSSIEEAEKSIRGYHHIITEMKEENSQLKSKQADLQDEIGMLKEEIKLLQEINDSDAPNGSGGDADEMVKLRSTLSQQSQAIKEYEREVSELESLVESKIYREDELETRVQELEAEMERLRKAKPAPAPSSTASHSRNPSEQSNGSTTVSGGSTETALRCELCEGPHDLDACPVFTGAPLEGGNTSPLNIQKGKKWCNDCGVSRERETSNGQSPSHNTAECPVAEDVF
ncbi:hypothetical protein CC85DRAFT_315955 [Cutaneotrichosporon oleaginosum]|uniref:CAP-Gly domain-containing protein n=1 Tax=Cutaneotrichosporon oleaginosum TaxID=879819 RepID=A0A0J0XSU8_9TREE|nr:uncharacterized protein CC85DRAFT_315955 [Cutaneotrichosporon oleaginosum]KLT44153.1 hypothetical protein CC85DRAFT_315955 [Cutaneotrichosporon oleaginosum]TXT09392.1 hypothetical protein COLE_03326 [Cutaneotrichosporon oleaginosum]